ncbi:Response regulator receiver domain-containing protein [Nitrosospira multiformis]|uniref:Response regulator receiver domain-containing protein n=1 Tax=Nitrosospira multiformis TaxID=1231 RepID=A0A1H8KUI7_9PROT|nr:response regulator [Nitrosospira multiformis]SEN96481.1 Response regulator receiver domain-containing protein [Nitrosospira multiformis]
MQTEDFALLSGLKVLIVDDEPGALDVTKRMLSFYQVQVIVCLSADEGLKQLQAHRLDVIVSDIIMPHVDGYQFIRAVRNLPADKGRDIPAIALSVLSEGEAQVKAINAGFQKYLCKPVRFAALIETVAAVAGIHPNNAR